MPLERHQQCTPPPPPPLPWTPAAFYGQFVLATTGALIKLLYIRLITFTCFKSFASFIEPDSLISKKLVSMVSNASEQMTCDANDFGENHVDDDNDFDDDGETAVKYGIKASLSGWHTVSNSNKRRCHMVPATAERWKGNSFSIHCCRNQRNQHPPYYHMSDSPSLCLSLQSGLLALQSAGPCLDQNNFTWIFTWKCIKYCAALGSLNWSQCYVVSRGIMWKVNKIHLIYMCERSMLPEISLDVFGREDVTFKTTICSEQWLTTWKERHTAVLPFLSKVWCSELIGAQVGTAAKQLPSLLALIVTHAVDGL